MNLFEFYRSKEWKRFREIVISERIHDDGFVYDEITGKPIVKQYDIILHHKIPLTEDNVNDFSISLNPDNIQIVSHKTHNIIHNKLGYARREVYLVYGAPFSGKSQWVKENANEGDLIINLDDIWQCISGCERYVKPNRLKAVAFKVRDELIAAVRYRLGKWCNAYIIGGYALSSERMRLCKELGAREILIESTEDACVERLESSGIKNKDDYRFYVAEWFALYTPPSDD